MDTVWVRLRSYQDYVAELVRDSFFSASGPVNSTFRHDLPPDYVTWSARSEGDQYRSLWEPLRAFFQKEGFTLWEHDKAPGSSTLYISTLPSPNGYAFRSLTWPSSLPRYTFEHVNGRQSALRGSNNQDYVVSVLSIAGSGNRVIRILRRLSSEIPDILLSNNHILPLVKEIVLEDIVFGLFPMLSRNLQVAIEMPSPSTSLEDLLYLVMQVLEAIVYIHSKNIAHRDVFFENFLIEWIPSSLKKLSCTRPRVYLIDFESAVEFSEDTAPDTRLCNDLPFPDDMYNRPRAPELTEVSLSYCPFRLDVWQLGHSLTDTLAITGIPEVDAMWGPMMKTNPEERPTAQEVLESLVQFMRKTPPKDLHLQHPDSDVWL
ncbi:hypothetical protein D9619_006765 [Psilocybe cf. subviscida]|uniref:Protein kinase domain-containing protein n=1 Tax=Psilocybe cf. subviscida TaxID=2480587 RepID=A0A8H5B4Y6_9AGAR|nr:hypothetical protein D9619_006765 [Psilocybe cf. subviscida]